VERKKVERFLTASKPSPKLSQTTRGKKQWVLTVPVWLCGPCSGDILDMWDTGLRDGVPKTSFTESERLNGHLLVHLFSFLEGLMAVQAACSIQGMLLISVSAIKKTNTCL